MCKEEVKKEVEEEIEGDKDEPGMLDVLQSKMVSRKLLVFIIATIFMSLGKVTPETWSYIAVTYIGILGLANIFSIVKNGK